MANTIKRHITHIKSKVVMEGKPKLPTAADIMEGEIAVNFAKGLETLSIKNESGNVVTFSSDNYYTEQKLGSGFTGANSANTVTKVIEDNEFAIATALNDLNENKLDASAYTPSDLSNYYTKSETDARDLWVSGSGTNAVAQKGGNNVASGDYSVAEGYNTSAMTSSSHAEGASTIASGYISHAEGISTKANGYYSHAEGYGTIASGESSHAEGSETKANGDYSHAEGDSTIASGESSHAEGYNTEANGDYSHAEGHNTAANGYNSHAEGYNTEANGDFSHAEGDNTIASEYSSHAEGDSTIASGYSSHAEGGNTTAGGLYSHAEGDNTIASGLYSHAEGESTVANNQSEHASGQYNVSSSASTTFGNSGNTLFSVGNGTSSNARHNAFEIRQNGDIYFVDNEGNDAKLQTVLSDIEELSEGTSAALNYLNTSKQDKITSSGLLKGNGSGTVSAAVAGTDYQAPLTFNTAPSSSNKVATMSDVMIQKDITNEGNNLNIDFLITPGSYRLGASHAGTFPTGLSANYAQMLVLFGGGDTYAQLYFPYSTSDVYLRTGNGYVSTRMTWNSWVKLSSSSDLSNYLPLSGGTITNGHITSSSGADSKLILNDTDGEGHSYIRFSNNDTSIGTFGIFGDSYLRWSGKRIVVCEYETPTTSNAYTIYPNIDYYLNTISQDTTFTFGPLEQFGSSNEYKFQFDMGSTAYSINMPSSIIWQDVPTFEASYHYEVSVKYDNIGQRYYGLCTAFELPTS